MTTRIAVDARSLCGPLTGIGNYVNEILKELGKDERFQFLLYCAPHKPLIATPEAWLVRASRLPRQVALRTTFKYWAQKDNVDVFWAPQTLAPRMQVPVVSTIHDLNYLLAPTTMSWGTKLAHKLWFNEDVRASRHLIANSFATAERLKNHLEVNVSAVARPGVSDNFCPASASAVYKAKLKYNLPSEYLIAVGTLEPRKNINALIEAHTPLFIDGKAPALVLVGRCGWKTDTRSFERPGLRLLGYVPDADLPALYSAAHALVIPSLYEGYGMPASEARACGCPVVATDIPELHESAGQDAIFITPTAEGISEGILLAAKTLRPAPIRLSSWSDAAKAYSKIFSELGNI